MKFSLKEFFLREYEDPTSSKHAQDDSKWAGPNSDKERMPHEIPQDKAQSNSSDAWEETRENGPKSSSQKSSGGGEKLKDFFGGAPYPKSSHEGTGKSSHESAKSSKLSEGGKGSGRKKGSKNKPRDEFGNVIKQEPVPPEEIPDELPDDWVADKPEDKGPGALATAGAKADEPEDDIDWASLDDDDFLDKLAGSEKGPEIKTQAAPPKPPKMKDTIKQEPKSSPYQTFDPTSDEFSSKGMWPDRKPKDPFQDNENTQTWDEFRAAAPKEAENMQREFKPEDLEGATFAKDRLRRVYMMTKAGKRYMYGGDDLGWDEMDDGNTPTGDF